MLVLIFAIILIAEVALVVVVVVVERLPASAQTVLLSTRGEVGYVRVNSAKQLPCASGTAFIGTIQCAIGVGPNKRCQRIANVPVGVNPKLKPSCFFDR